MIAALLLLQVRCQFALIAENGALGAGTPFWVAARFRPQPGWHVYWQNPGDSGLPTVLEWELPAGYKVTETRWPAPAVFESSGIVTFGYDREFSVLARISPPADERGGGIIALRARADWMACKEACETGSSKSTLQIRVANREVRDKAETAFFATARALLPENGASLNPKYRELEKSYRVSLRIPNAGQAVRATFLPLDQGLFGPSANQNATFSRSSTDLEIEKTSSQSAKGKPLEGILRVVYSKDAVRNFEIRAAFQP